MRLPRIGTAHCNHCGGEYTVTTMECRGCASRIEGNFRLPRLAYLSPEDRRFVELFVLSSGNIKRMEKALGISYPTVRNRLDKVVSFLRTIIEQDDSAPAKDISKKQIQRRD